MSRVLQLRVLASRDRATAACCPRGGAAVAGVGIGHIPEGEYAVFPWSGYSLLTVVTSVAPNR